MYHFFNITIKSLHNTDQLNFTYVYKSKANFDLFSGHIDISFVLFLLFFFSSEYIV